MAQVVAGFKVDEKLKEKLDILIDSSGLQKNEWLEKAYELMQSQNIKESNPTFTKEITEINHHSTRIVELFNNMILQSEYLRADAVTKLEQKLDEKDTIISNYLQKQSEINSQLKTKEEELEKITKELEVLTEEHSKVATQNENTQELIDSLREKNEDLKSKLEDYEATKEKLEFLKQELNEAQDKANRFFKEYQNETEVNSALKLQHEQLINELKEKNSNLLEETDTKHAAELSKIIADHAIELTSLQEKHEFEIERKELQKEKEFQEREKTINALHQEEIAKQSDSYRELFAKLEDKNNIINDLKEEILKLKSINKE